MKLFKEEIICAGFGGQGIMLMGKLLTYTGMEAGYEVSWIPSYGAEVRGGTAHSMVKLQKNCAIANPVVVNPSVCIVMSKPSLDKFMPRVRKGGMLLLDTTTIGEIPKTKGIIVKTAPFEKIAAEFGNKRAANMVILGALNKIKNYFPLDLLKSSIKYMFPGRDDIYKMNVQALDKGYSLDL